MGRNGEVRRDAEIGLLSDYVAEAQREVDALHHLRQAKDGVDVPTRLAEPCRKLQFVLERLSQLDPPTVNAILDGVVSQVQQIALSDNEKLPDLAKAAIAAHVVAARHRLPESVAASPSPTVMSSVSQPTAASEGDAPIAVVAGAPVATGAPLETHVRRQITEAEWKCRLAVEAVKRREAEVRRAESELVKYLHTCSALSENWGNENASEWKEFLRSQRAFVEGTSAASKPSSPTAAAARRALSILQQQPVCERPDAEATVPPAKLDPPTTASHVLGSGSRFRQLRRANSAPVRRFRKGRRLRHRQQDVVLVLTSSSAASSVAHTVDNGAVIRGRHELSTFRSKRGAPAQHSRPIFRPLQQLPDPETVRSSKMLRKESLTPTKGQTFTNGQSSTAVSGELTLLPKKGTSAAAAPLVKKQRFQARTSQVKISPTAAARPLAVCRSISLPPSLLHGPPRSPRGTDRIWVVDAGSGRATFVSSLNFVRLFPPQRNRPPPKLASANASVVRILNPHAADVNIAKIPLSRDGTPLHAIRYIEPTGPSQKQSPLTVPKAQSSGCFARKRRQPRKSKRVHS